MVFGHIILACLFLLTNIYAFPVSEDTMWTWISGNDTLEKYGNYGEKGVPSIDNYPGGRSHAVSWIDEENQMLYIFGGDGHIKSSTLIGQLNDLWSYSIETNEWTWISGSDQTNQKGYYGEKGVPSIDNYPGSRRYAASWTDKENNILYLFGGYGYDEEGSKGVLNDFWSYSIETNEWTWIAGSNTYGQYGHYGEKGVPSIDNYPGSREASIYWIDETNKVFYLFGGSGYGEELGGYLNDLWSYSIETNEWTWISGSKTANQVGNYGEKGVPSIDNYPGSHTYSLSWFDETNQVLYLFGGFGPTGDTIGYRNDFWSYSFETNEWTWISGSTTSGSHYGNYGEKGVPSIDNYPGSLISSFTWIDKENNMLYLFGGMGLGEKDFGVLNHIWSYSIETKEWTWISGSKTYSQNGNYGEKGVPSIDNYPGSRLGGAIWSDETNNVLYIFGGEGNSRNSKGILNNDLWSLSKFSPPIDEDPDNGNDEPIEESGIKNSIMNNVMVYVLFILSLHFVFYHN